MHCTTLCSCVTLLDIPAPNIPAVYVWSWGSYRQWWRGHHQLCKWNFSAQVSRIELLHASLPPPSLPPSLPPPSLPPPPSPPPSSLHPSLHLSLSPSSLPSSRPPQMLRLCLQALAWRSEGWREKDRWLLIQPKYM